MIIRYFFGVSSSCLLVLFILGTMLYSKCVSAAYFGGFVPQKIQVVGNLIQFSVTKTPPSDTCSYYGRFFSFDATTEAGKNMYSLLLAAKLANKGMYVTYISSTRPSTNQQSGCSIATMAQVSSLGMN